MRSFRHPLIWLLPGALWLIWLCYASLAPVPESLQLSSDKLAHLLAYLLLVFGFGCALRPQYLPLLLLLGAALGLLLEVLQGLTAYRLFEWTDALANLLGAVSGALLASSPAGHLYLRLERKFYA